MIAALREIGILLCCLLSISSAALAGGSSCVDTAVAGLSLLDGKSVHSRLGDVAERGKWVDPATWVLTLRSSEGSTLKLVRHPGAERLAFAKFVLVREADSNDDSINVDFSFKTSCGVELGMNRSTVEGLLGSPSERSTMGEKVEYIYTLSEDSALVSRHNAWKYKAAYEFINDTLSRIEFGFLVP